MKNFVVNLDRQPEKYESFLKLNAGAGIAFHRHAACDGAALYVAESFLHGVSRIPISADGSAGRRDIVARLPGTVPDGVRLCPLPVGELSKNSRNKVEQNTLAVAASLVDFAASHGTCVSSDAWELQQPRRGADPRGDGTLSAPGNRV